MELCCGNVNISEIISKSDILLIGALEYNQNETDVNYLTVSADFDYKLYEIVTL